MPRARKDPPAPVAPTRAAGSMRKWLVQFLLPLALGAGLLIGLVSVGRYLASRLPDEGEHSLAFTDIECPSPPGMTRREFLAEAQSLAGLPDRLNLLEPATKQRIFDALALHPWVARVDRVDLLSGPEVRAELAFRRPALVVNPTRVVDDEGILLPPQASPGKLPRLATRVRSPAARAGQLWEDPVVQAAARVAGLLRDELARRRGGSAAVFEVRAGEVVIHLGRTRILWGQPPGRELPGEASAAVKGRRLAGAGEPDGQQWDLRPEARMGRSAIER